MKTKSLYLLILIASTMFFVTGCKDDEINGNDGISGDDVSKDTGHPVFTSKGWHIDGKDVYMVDYFSDGIQYYKNDQLTVLETYTNNYAGNMVEDIYASGNNVYVVGTLTQANNQIMHQTLAYCWKNGVKSTLQIPPPPPPDNSGEYGSIEEYVISEAYAYRVIVHGSDVYVLGAVKWWYKMHGGSLSGLDGAVIFPGYWKNGQFTVLQMPDDMALILLNIEKGNIVVSNGDVYVVDGKRNYWKNGQFVSALSTIHNNETFYAEYPMCASVNDVYIAGSEYTDISDTKQKACYWKNGVRIDLPVEGTNSATASGITVVGNDVYVSGNMKKMLNEEENSYATYPVYWKNGQLITLPFEQFSSGLPSLSYTLGIYASGNDMYFLGYDAYKLCYWKNGKKYYYPDLTNNP